MIKLFYCKNCKWKSLKEKEKCPLCNSKTFSKKILPVGRVLSYTTLYIPPEGYEPPINFVLVEIKGLKLITYKGDSLPIEIGENVKIEYRNGKFYSYPAPLSEKIKTYIKYIFG